MVDFDRDIPVPENPYRIPLIVNVMLGLVGVMCLAGSGGPSAEEMIAFVCGIILVTLSAIFLFGFIVASKGFSKRFSVDRMVDYWEVGESRWKTFVEHRKKVILMRGGIMGGFLALTVVAVMLYMAYTEGDLAKVIPIAVIVGGFILLVFAGVIGMQLSGLRGDSGKVWLSKDGVLMNGTVFFRNAMGVFVRRCELVEDSEGSTLEIEYLVSGGKTRAEHLLKVPVAEDKVATVIGVTRGWA